MALAPALLATGAASMFYSGFRTSLTLMPFAIHILTQAQADGYALELRRRLQLSHPLTTQESLAASLGPAQPPENPPPPEMALPTAVDGSSVSKSVIARISRSSSPGEEPSNHIDIKGKPEDVVEISNGRQLLPAGVPSNGGRNSRGLVDEMGLFGLLEASLRCQHCWLCSEAFREVSAMLGSGDGRGLPPKPRDLTAVLSLLQSLISVLFVGCFQEKGRGVE